MKLKVKEIDKLIPEEIKIVTQTFKEKGFSCFIVGGSIRDLLLGIKVKDFDLATDALPQQVMEIFARTAPTGIKFGTITILGLKRNFEVTTFRADGRYSDSRRPDEVSFTKDIKTDLSRRDFTINALAYNPLDRELIDLFQGIEDLKAKIIRSVGDPRERFNEDGLRPFRACRFAALLNFRIEEKTLAAISKTLEAAKKVASERVRDELNKIMQAEKPSTAFELLRENGLLKIIIPELLEGFGISQNEFHFHDVYYHSLNCADAAKTHIRWAALFHDLAKPRCQTPEGNFYNHEIVGAQMAKNILERLRFSNEEIEKTTHLIKQHMFFYQDEWTDSAVRRFVRKAKPEYLEDLYALREADVDDTPGKEGSLKALKKLKKRIEKIKAQEAALKLTDLAIDGYDIMKLGIVAGPKVGEILNKLLEEVIDEPQKNNREVLLQLARNMI